MGSKVKTRLIEKELINKGGGACMHMRACFLFAARRVHTSSQSFGFTDINSYYENGDLKRREAK